MRERKMDLQTFILSFNNSHILSTDEEAKRLCKRLLTSLRKQARRKGWSYKIWLYYSYTQGVFIDNSITVRPHNKPHIVRKHIHVVLYATPFTTILKWIKQYWSVQGYVLRDKDHNKRTPTNLSSFLDSYLKPQATLSYYHTYPKGYELPKVDT